MSEQSNSQDDQDYVESKDENNPIPDPDKEGLIPVVEVPEEAVNGE